jgi:hypothetical protein
VRIQGDSSCQFPPLSESTNVIVSDQHSVGGYLPSDDANTESEQSLLPRVHLNTFSLKGRRVSLGPVMITSPPGDANGLWTNPESGSVILNEFTTRHSRRFPSKTNGNNYEPNGL